MLSCRKQESGVRSEESERRRLSRIIIFCLLPTAYCLLFSGCRRDMQDQPKAIAYRENSFYKDGTGSRPLVEGTVARGYLREDRALYLGKKPATGNAQNAGAPAPAPANQANTANSNSASALYPDDVETRSEERRVGKKCR